MIPLLLAALAPLPAPQATAHVPRAWFPGSQASTVPWPGTLAVAAKDRLLIGEVTGDGQLDAIVFNGAEPTVVYGPVVYDAVFGLGRTASSAALLPSSAPGGGDSLVLSDATGVHVLSGYDGGVFQERSFAGSWDDVHALRTGDTDGDGTLDLVGVSGQQLLFLEHVVDVGGPQESVLPIGTAILDHRVLDWNGSPAHPVALLTDLGFFVVSKTGAVLLALPGTVTSGALATFREPGVPHDRCAVLFENGAGWALVALDATRADPAVPLAGACAPLVLVADVQLDGRDDLVLFEPDTNVARLLTNHAGKPGTTGSFGPAPKDGERIEFSPGVLPLPGESSVPALGDLDGDGDVDLAMFVGPANGLTTIPNQRVLGGPQRARVTGGSYSLDENVDEGTLRLRVELPAALPFSPTHVETVVWKQPGTEDGSLPMEPVAVAHTFAPVVDHEAQSVTVLREPDLFTYNVYHFDVRPVRLSQGQVVRVGPSLVSAFATPATITNDLEAEFGPGVPLRILLIEEGRDDEYELSASQLAERSLAPKEVQTIKIPLIEVAPDPFD